MKIRIRETGEIITESEFRHRSNASFPAVLTAENIDAIGADLVTEVSQPDYDKTTHYLEESASLVNGQYVQSWSVVARNASEIAKDLALRRASMVVTMRQARLALLAAGLLDGIDIAIATMPRAAQIEWEFASEVRRDNALIAAVQAVAGLSDSQIDDMFVSAAKQLPREYRKC